MYRNDKPWCDYDCDEPVTHIGEKGYIYCLTHAARRCGYERTRKMRPWELSLIREGKPVPSYRPITKARATALDKQD